MTYKRSPGAAQTAQQPELPCLSQRIRGSEHDTGQLPLPVTPLPGPSNALLASKHLNAYIHKPTLIHIHILTLTRVHTHTHTEGRGWGRSGLESFSNPSPLKLHSGTLSCGRHHSLSGRSSRERNRKGPWSRSENAQTRG